VHTGEAHGADVPEELRTLLEDACIAQDLDAAARLFEQGAVLALPGAAVTAPENIARAGAGLRAALAAPSRVVQAGDLAVSLGSCIGVMRRGTDRAWRYAILVGREGSR
jgi:hypothetical protein